MRTILALASRRSELIIIPLMAVVVGAILYLLDAMDDRRRAQMERFSIGHEVMLAEGAEAKLFAIEGAEHQLLCLWRPGLPPLSIPILTDLDDRPEGVIAQLTINAMTPDMNPCASLQNQPISQ